MTGGARVSSGITGGLKKTIQDIREIAGEHSDDDIYAMLKDCSMDPNEAAQRLLHLDTFHEVRKKHGRRNENVMIKPFDNHGRHHDARVGSGYRVDVGARVGRGNFQSHNTSQNNVKRNIGGSKENGFMKMSKGHDHESGNKTTPLSSRSVHVKVNGKCIQGGVPQANMGIISNAGHVTAHDTLISDEKHMPAGGDKMLALKLKPASMSAIPNKIMPGGNHVDSSASAVQRQPSSCMCSETLTLDPVLPSSNLVDDDQNAVPIGDATWSNDKIQNGGPISYMVEAVDNAKSQLTEFNDQPCEANYAAKDSAFDEMNNYVEKLSISEKNISVLNEEMSKLNVTDGPVIFPEHLQVPEAYKAKLAFGSFDSSWVLDGKPTGNANSVNSNMPADDSCLMKTVSKSFIESNGSTFEGAHKREDPSHLQSTTPMSNNMPPFIGRTSSDVVIKIDEPETENLLHNEGPDLANHLSNYTFGYAQAQLKAHDGVEIETQGGNVIASSTTSIDHSSVIRPSGATHDIVSTPPFPLFRQTYYPNFFPYGHYYPQFFVPQVQQYLSHGGFHPQPLVPNPNVYLASAAAGIKYPHQQPNPKEGSAAGTDGYIGVPSGYNPYVPYGLPPAVIPWNVARDDDHASQMKEDIRSTTEHQTQSSDVWMGVTGQTLSGLQMNPFYSLAPGQGHPMVFPPTPTGLGPFGGVYHPAVQSIPAPQPTMHSHIQQPQSTRPAEPPSANLIPSAGSYQQQPQGAHFIRNNNKQ